MDPNTLLVHPAFLLALAILGPLVRDFVAKLLRQRAREVRTDKDPKNDGQAAILDAAADAVEKAPLPFSPKVKP